MESKRSDSKTALSLQRGCAVHAELRTLRNIVVLLDIL
jgi:hypothetical protein